MRGAFLRVAGMTAMIENVMADIMAVCKGDV
jgi:hypothetical protein